MAREKATPPPTSGQSTTPSQRRSRRSNRGTVGHADWRHADFGLVSELVVRATSCMCSITLGCLGELDAYQVRVFGDGETYSDTVRPSEDIDEYLRGLIAYFADNGQEILLENRKRYEDWKSSRKS